MILAKAHHLRYFCLVFRMEHQKDYSLVDLLQITNQSEAKSDPIAFKSFEILI